MMFLKVGGLLSVLATLSVIPDCDGNILHRWTEAAKNLDPTLDGLKIEPETRKALALQDEPTNRRTSIANATFTSLTCNFNIEKCEPWSDYFGNDAAVSSEVTIECGKCVSMEEFTNGEELSLEGGLNIIGTLNFTQETRVTIKTPYVFVQGKLSMENNKVVNGTPAVKILLTGTENVKFIPDSDNVDSCPTDGCDVGKKPIIVAGGEIDIKGLPDNCSSWVRMEESQQGDLPVPSADYDTSVSPPSGTTYECTEIVLEEDFSSGLNGWYGNLGATEEHKDNGIQVANRRVQWQGPIVEISSVMKECIVPDTTYIFSAKIRLTTEDPSTQSLCVSAGTNCLVAKYSHMSDDDEINFATIAEMHSSQAVPDGDWFTFKGSFELSRTNLASTDLFAAMSISGPESGVIIDMDYISLTMAKHEPSTADSVCLDLVRSNGDASSGVPFPMRSFMPNTDLQIKYSDGNPFFHLSKRTEQFSTLVMDLIPGCAVAETVYRFSSKIWIHSATSTLSRVMLKVTHTDKSTPSMDLMKICPESSESTGWVTCDANFQFTADHFAAKKLEVLFITLDNTDDIDYDDLSFKFVKSPIGDTGLKLHHDVNKCWGVGAQVLITSSTINYNDEQVVTIASVSSDGTVTFDESDLKIPTSVKDSEDFAEELALLSRNIVFEADIDDANPLHGGHMMILQTPGDSKQVMEGVGIVNFGQQGVANRFPITFHNTGDSSDSILSKNAILHSNQRCIVLEGTSRLKIANNVAYDAFGHCYSLEDGSEIENEFTNNIGARIKRATVLISSTDTDHSPAVFHIKNPNNRYSGNVAAGCQDSGFGFALSGDAITSELGLFENNTAHSMSGEGLKTYADGYSPANVQTFKEFKAFRNRGIGILFENSKNIFLDKGIVADNKINIKFDRVDSSKVKDYDVIGYSEEYKLVAEVGGYARHCWGTTPPLLGIKISASAKDAGTSSGTILENIHFSNWKDDLGCPSSVALSVNNVILSNSFDAAYSLKDVTVDAFTPSKNIISFCDAFTAGMKTVRITDESGTLNPDGSNEEGTIVTDDAAMTSMYDTCQSMTGSCAAYCVGGGCVRTISVEINSQGSEDTTLVVMSTEGSERIVEGSFTSISASVDTLWTQRRSYNFALAQGEFTAKFVSDDVEVWPDFAVVQYGDIPDCDTYFDSFALSVPPIDTDTCTDLITNGDFQSFATSDDITKSGWHHTGGKMVASQNPAGWALSTDGRSDPIDGLGQFLDTRCMTIGQQYSISAQVKLTPPGGYDGAPGCDPNQIAPGGNRCPRINVLITKEGIPSYIFAVGDTLAPFLPGEWNSLLGTFEVTSEMADADSVFLYIDGVRDGVEIQIDDVAATFIDVDCTELVLNGDFAGGNTADWSFVGDSTGLKVIDNSVYGESGYSLSTIQRGGTHWGMMQALSKSCILPGLVYEFNAEFRLEDQNGISKDCDPQYFYTSTPTCPRLVLKTVTEDDKGIQIPIYEDVAWAVGPLVSDGWNKLYGTFKATPAMTTAVRVELSLIDAAGGLNEVLANVSMKPADENTLFKPTCTELVRNGDAEVGDSRYWYIKGGANYGKISMVSPGANGSSAAFHHHEGRALVFNGLWQVLDRACTAEVSVWKVTADFKLFDANGDPVSCVKTSRSGDNVCPMFMFQSVLNSGGSPHNTAPLHNLSEGDWELGEWNHFENEFIMTSEHFAMDQTWFFIHNVNIGYSYMVDNISIVPV